MAVDDEIVQRLPYAPPTSEYARTLWQSARALGQHEAPAVASAGWLASKDGQTPPIFVAHSMLAAVWLLNESLPMALRSPSDNAVFARLTQLAACAQVGAPEPPAVISPAPIAQDLAGEESLAAVRKAQQDPAPAAPSRRVTKRQRAATPVARPAEPPVKRFRGIPRLRAPPASAPAAEHETHRSFAHSQDVPIIAWIVEQPTGPHNFFESAALPYTTAKAMLSAARALGNTTAQLQATYFVRNWRQSGHPLRMAGSVSGPLALLSRIEADGNHGSGIGSGSSSAQQLELAMSAITVSEAITATAGVAYRWGMASLGQQYHSRISQLRQACPAMPDKQLQTAAKESLWHERSANSTWTWNAFSMRLKRSRRWRDAVETLGWGILLLIPTDIVTRNWVEQTLRAAHWRIWLELVQRVNPDATGASRDFDAWLGPSRSMHGSLDGTATLTFELTKGSRLAEVPDSDDDKDSDESEDVLSDALPLDRLFQPHALQ